MKKLPRNIPYYIFSGEQDPVHFPSGNYELVSAIRKAGVTNIKHRLFPDGRHEMLNEINRDEVNNELLLWLNEEGLHIPSQQIQREVMA